MSSLSWFLLFFIAVFVEIHYCVKQDVTKLKWSFAPNEVLSKNMYEDEICLISAGANEILKDSPHLPIVNEYKHLLNGMCANASLESAWDRLTRSKMSPGCTIAGAYYRCLNRKQGGFEHVPNQCGATIQDRYSFFASHFENLVPSRQGPNVSHALSLYNTLLELNYTHFAEQGDSISFQVFLALQGTWQRLSSQANYVDHSLRMSRGSFMPCGLQHISRSSQDPRECFTANNTLCTDEAQADFIERYTLRVLQERGRRYVAGTGVAHTKRQHHDHGGSHHQSQKNHQQQHQQQQQQEQQERTIVLFHPFGVHIWDVDAGVAGGIARGIIAAGKAAQARNSTLLVLESPAQHFVYDVDSEGQEVPASDNSSGLYQQENEFYRGQVSGPCCRKTVASDKGNFRNVALLEALELADPAWRNYVGWIPFYHISQQVHNGHVDVQQDCTHFSYSPLFYAPLWQAMEQEILRLQ